MKKFKFLVLGVMASLALVGCANSGGNGNAGELPSGGKEVDLTTPEGKETLKKCLKETINAYCDLDLKSFSVTAKASEKAELDASATVKDMGSFALNVNVKNYSAEATLKAANNNGKMDASLESKLNASATVKGSLPTAADPSKSSKIDASFNVKDAKFNAYLTGSKVYADVSAIDSVVANTESFVNDILGDLKDSMVFPYITMAADQGALEGIYDAAKNQIKLSSAIDEALPKDMRKFYVDMGEDVAWPELKLEVSDEDQAMIDGYVDMALSYLDQLAALKIGLSVKTYSEKAYGFELGMTKDSLKSIITMVGGEDAAMINGYLDKLINKFDVKASIYFNKKALLEKVGFSLDADCALKSLADLGAPAEVTDMFEKFNFSAKMSGSLELTAKYNDVKVSLPSNFNGYKELEMGGNKSSANY